MAQFENLFEKNNLPNNLDILGRNIRVNPSSLIFSQQGLDRYHARDFPGAVSAFTIAINAQPTNHYLYKMRGTAYEDMGNDVDAEKDFIESLELEPNDSVSAYRLGMIYYRGNQPEQAVNWLKVALKNSENLDLDHIGLGNNNILFIHTKVICGNLGNFLVQLGRREEGYKYLDQAIRLDPSYSPPYVSKGLALFEDGEKEIAVEFIIKASELGHPKAPAIMHLMNEEIGDSRKSKASNPLNIIDDPQLNELHQLPNYAKAYANDLAIYSQVMRERDGGFTVDEFIELIVYYAIDLLIEYRNKAMNTLPSSVVTDVQKQIIEAAQMNFDVFYDQRAIDKIHSLIAKKIRESEIISETQIYMSQINKHL